MFYKFNVHGIYCGTSTEKIPYSTDVAPPDENETYKWVWNHYNWIGMPSNWTPVQATYVEPPVVEETPAESTPPTE